MDSKVTIIHRGHKIIPVEGGWSIVGYNATVFTTVNMAKQHIQMLERPTPDRFIVVNGQPFELSQVTAVSLLPNGKFGLSVTYKSPGGAHLL